MVQEFSSEKEDMVKFGGASTGGPRHAFRSLPEDVGRKQQEGCEVRRWSNSHHTLTGGPEEVCGSISRGGLLKTGPCTVLCMCWRDAQLCAQTSQETVAILPNLTESV